MKDEDWQREEEEEGEGRGAPGRGKGKETEGRRESGRESMGEGEWDQKLMPAAEAQPENALKAAHAT
eukprot:3941143-Rhodomonas_salina.1